jgi:hypothetical protein
LLPTIGAAMIIVAGPETWVSTQILSRPVMVYLGLISYPLYLWHWPLLVYVNLAAPVDAEIRFLKLAAVAMAILFAIGTYRLLERPLRLRFTPQRLVSPLVVCVMVAAAIGAAVHARDGFPSRTAMFSNPFKPSPARSEGCMARYGLPSPEDAPPYCLETRSDKPVEVMILGDSHAHALFSGIKDLGLVPGDEGSVLMIGGPGCPFLRHTRFWREDEPSKKFLCPPLLDAVYRTLDEVRPKMIVVTARFQAYIPGEHASSQERASPRGHFEAVSYPDKPVSEFIVDLLTADLQAILSRASTVVLLLQAPELDVDPRRCLRARPIERHFPSEVSCNVGREKVMREQGVYRSVLEDVAKRIGSSRLRLIDPMAALCDAKDCYAMKDGMMLYRDRHHLNADGARYVWLESGVRGAQ